MTYNGKTCHMSATIGCKKPLELFAGLRVWEWCGWWIWTYKYFAKLSNLQPSVICANLCQNLLWLVMVMVMARPSEIVLSIIVSIKVVKLVGYCQILVTHWSDIKLCEISDIGSRQAGSTCNFTALLSHQTQHTGDN